jgi:hypothetical protein
MAYSNLVTNVHAGEGNRPWVSGGEQPAQWLLQRCMPARIRAVMSLSYADSDPRVKYGMLNTLLLDCVAAAITNTHTHGYARMFLHVKLHHVAPLQQYNWCCP